MTRKQIPRMSAKQMPKKMAMLFAHRIVCDGLIDDLVEKGLAYFDDNKKSHWTQEGKKYWREFYSDLATFHESWQCLAFASVFTDMVAEAFEAARTAKSERPGCGVDSSKS